MQHIAEIQKNLRQGQTDTFQKWIVSPVKKMLNQRITETYPHLKEEASDILEDVFGKFKQLIKKWKLDEEVLDVDKELWSLAQKECKLAEPTKENRQKNLDLSRSEFKKMCTLLKQGKEVLIEKVYLSHFKQCVNYLMIREGAAEEEAHNSSMDALYEIRKDLLQDKIFYGNLAYYFTYRAKKKLYKWRHKQKKSNLILDEIDFEDVEKTETELIQSELAALLSKAIKKLSHDCRLIIKSFYYEDQSLKEIAEKVNKSHAAIRKQTTRCRDKLRIFLGENFYEQFSNYLSD